jgi:hypothetical protein
MRAISLMHVEIDDGGAADPPFTLQQPDCDGDVVEHAEPLAVIGEGVMRAAGEVHRGAIAQRVARRGDGAPHGTPRPLDERRRPRQPELTHLGGAELTVDESVYVLRRMHEAQHLISRALGIEHALGGHQPLGDDRVAQQRVLRHGKAMPLGKGKGVPRRGPDGERHQSNEI